MTLPPVKEETPTRNADTTPNGDQKPDEGFKNRSTGIIGGGQPSNRYNDNDGKNGKKGKKVALIIVALLLGFAIVGAGVYALVHFVFMPQIDSNIDATEAPTVAPMPTLAPTPTAPPATQAPTEPDYGAMADAYMKNMTEREKLCQLFIVTPEALTAAMDDSGDGGAVTLAGEMTKESLEAYPVGGIIYNSDNLEDAEQTKKLIANSQSYSKTPLFIDVDEEGGNVARVASKLGTKKYEPMLTYKDQGEQVALDNAKAIAADIRSFGFNMDNAPVADVLSNPANTVIGDRAYSDDYAQAAKLVAAAVKGFNEGGVISVLKHFPGHGGTSEDSHDGLAYVNTSVEDLKKNELQPFKAGIEAGADMVMIGHLVVKELDAELPATLSSKVVPELLRKELNYNGIVISDGMAMGAIVDNYDYDTIVKGLFAADVDIILQPDNLDAYLEAISDAVANGSITQEQIDAKVRKILTLKYKRGIMQPAAANTAAQPATTAGGASETPTASPVTTAQPTDAAVPSEQPSVAA